VKVGEGVGHGPLMDPWGRDDEQTRRFDLRELRAALAPPAPMARRGRAEGPARVIEIAPPASSRDLRRE
jgi:hypothetical protein